MKTLSERLPVFIEKYFRFLFAFVLLVAAFNLFYRLDALPVQLLDEAREGITAFEMAESGNWLQHSYLGSVDYSNTKPPVLFWLISLSYKIFGYGIFALRFPSALAGFISILLTMLLAKKAYGKIASIFTGLILSTSYAFIHFHSARKGDFDSLLALTILLSMFWLFHSDKRKWFLYLSGLAAGLAFLVKSLAVIQIFGIVIAYLLFTGKWKKFQWKDYLIYFVSFALPVLAWAALRFGADGLNFFRAMVTNDISLRVAKNIGSLPDISIWYFGVVLAHFFPWSLLIISFLFYRNRFQYRTSRSGKNEFQMDLNGFFRHPLFVFWIAVPFTLFSLSSTRLDWYINGIYPALAVMLGWFIADLISLKKIDRYFLRGLRAFCVFAVMFLVYETASVIVLNDQNSKSDQRFLREMKTHGNGKRVMVFVNRGENTQELFLAMVLKKYRTAVAANYADFASADADAVLYLPDTPEGSKILKDYGLYRIESGYGYQIAGKTNSQKNGTAAADADAEAQK